MGTDKKKATKVSKINLTPPTPNLIEIKGEVEMTNLQEKIREYREYARMIEELEALKTAIADDLKSAMTEAGQDKMVVGEYKLSYTEAKRETLDKQRLAADLGDLREYTKVTTYKRFNVA